MKERRRVLMMGKARRRVLMMGKARRREGAQGVQFSRLHKNMQRKQPQMIECKKYISEHQKVLFKRFNCIKGKPSYC